jgi:hypothetical protein
MSIHSRDLLRYVVAHLLEGVGRISRADPTRSEIGLPTIYVPDAVDGRPSSMKSFEVDYYAMTEKWRKLVAKEDGLSDGCYKDGMSCKEYFESDLEDDHYKHKSIVPFFYVEPGPVSCSLESSVFMLGCQGEGVEIPLLEKATGYKTGGYSEFKGRPFPASQARFVTQQGYQARRNGINYLFSGRYTRGNGLSQFRQVKFTGSGVMTDDLAMAGGSGGNLAERRWHTYHNPLPNPSECFTSLPAAFSYTYSGGAHEPSISEFVNVKMSSMFGALVVDEPGNKKSVYHRDIPEHLHEVVAETGGLYNFMGSVNNMVDLSTAVSGEGANFTYPEERAAPERINPVTLLTEEGNVVVDESPPPIKLNTNEDNETPASSTILRLDTSENVADAEA